MWLQENTNGVHTKYASLLLHSATFLSRKMNCTATPTTVCQSPAEFLHERLGQADPQVIFNLFVNTFIALSSAVFYLIVFRKQQILQRVLHLQLVKK
jgi:hypothetical protein